ncbi:MAG: ABC transporter ATP-binding protein [Burkholderiales bacterium]|nr:ABC transporter ATP-binding protein [Burkholderiales bacterium]
MTGSGREHHPPPVVDLHGLRFAWRATDRDLLRIDALRVPAGEHIFLRGASGSGKSTLLSLLAGVLVPDRGRILLLGHDLTTLSGTGRDRMRADHVGFIFQMFNLIPYLSVMENVVLPCGFSPRRRARALAHGGSVRAEATRLLGALDMADPALLSRPVTRLSVGQQQRVAAARALIGAPELVVADEPTSALDADRRDAFVDLLFRECRRAGSALVFVSHDAALAPMFDRTIELADINHADGADEAGR